MLFLIALAAGFLPVTVATPVSAQQSDAKSSADVVVTGKKQREERTAGAVTALDEYSVRFARCAKKVDIRLLHKIIDGEPYSSPSQYALDRAIRTNMGCYMGYHTPGSPEPYYGVCNAIDNHAYRFRLPVCRAPYDRAALVAEAIARYAPDVRLTKTQTMNVQVQARLGAREKQRNRLRPLTERQYVAVTLCMVGNAPEAAADLVHNNRSSKLQKSAADRLIEETSECTGDAKELKIDRVEFRNYVVDAFYSWLVAARNVPSLLPLPPDQHS
ncbi:hypothetical protein LQ953_08640 [Sphingomonas sp. IC-56]|uniref:hypothetical protein n=1 Tax=Sphingomonas sp. IC-56 TaxID=2898529 RepID=UPI001E621BD0|nr:hypothetical protein [Sphingomonas sp. IC-56]MCD2324076.1 hypothetical protein [Sphingomonas sp. IC-56]